LAMRPYSANADPSGHQLPQRRRAAKAHGRLPRVVCVVVPALMEQVLDPRVRGTVLGGQTAANLVDDREREPVVRHRHEVQVHPGATLLVAEEVAVLTCRPRAGLAVDRPPRQQDLQLPQAPAGRGHRGVQVDVGNPERGPRVRRAHRVRAAPRLMCSFIADLLRDGADRAGCPGPSGCAAAPVAGEREAGSHRVVQEPRPRPVSVPWPLTRSGQELGVRCCASGRSRRPAGPPRGRER
jgi:hypothetical protein